MDVSPDPAREHLAISLAWKTWQRMTAGMSEHVFDLDALRGAALLGAAKALAQFDARPGIQFRSYAISLIRGEILEEMRAQDHLPRSLRQLAKRIEARTGERPWWADGPLSFERVFSGSPDDDLDPLHLGHTLAADADTEAEALQRIEDEELWHVVGWLPDAEEFAIRHYYQHGETFKEIAAHLDRSESCAHQVHTRALGRLCEFLGAEPPNPAPSTPHPAPPYEHPPCVICGAPVPRRESESAAKWKQRIACGLECGWQVIGRRQRARGLAGLGVEEGG